MKVKLLKAWKRWPAGHLFTDMPPNLASELTRRGIGEKVADLRDVDVPRQRSRARGGMRAGADYETR